ncbi:MAG: hypothetical protein ACYTHM_19480 [Planctomycetota bacterium]
MLGDAFYEDEFYALAPRSTFQDLLNDAVRQTPWWLLSLAVHGLVAVLLTLAHFTEYRQDNPVVVETDLETPIDNCREDELERDPFQKDREIDTEEPTIEDPVLKDADEADHNEKDDNDIQEGSKGLDEALSDKPLKGRFWNTCIGPGGGLGGAWGSRIGGRRDLRARGSGGRHMRAAVTSALIWLKQHQNADGMWSCRKFTMNCKRGSCTGAGSSDDYDMGVTGLAMLAFLGAGNTHKHGRFKTTVKNGLKAMKERQTPDGCFGPKTGDGHWIYNHAIASMAMAEAYGMGRKSPLLQNAAQRGIDFLVGCQNPYLGWRYGSQTGESDSSVTGWAVLALKSAMISELHVPKESMQGALHWFDKVTDEAYHKTGYTSKGDTGARLKEAIGKFQSTEAMTAVAVISRIFIQGKKAGPRPEILGGGNLLKQNPPKWDVRGGTIDMYYWYYGTLAMFQLGGSYWKAWEEPLKNAILPTQMRTGCENGSWDPVGAWGTAGGRVYSTAINCLSLEIYYRYARVLNVK